MIRDYRPTDRAACADILTRAMKHAFHWMDVDPVDPEEFDRLTDGEIIRVAESKGRLCGVSSVWTAEHFLHHFYIAPEAHRQGIGRALLEDSLRDNHQHLSLKCQTQNMPARAFYHAMGFIETHEASGSEGPFGPWIWVRTPAAIAALNQTC